MRERKIRAALWPYIRKEFEKDKVSFIYSQGRLSTELSSKMYHRYVERAMCEEQKKRTNRAKNAVCSFKMYLDGESPKGNFVVLNKDNQRFLTQVGQMTEAEIKAQEEALAG